MAYTFTTDGDYVIFSETTRIDGSYIRKLAKTSKAVEWSYDDSTPVTISFVVDNLDYRNVRIGNIIIDGETMSTTAGFETAIGTIFPNLAGGGATEVTVYQRTTNITNSQVLTLDTVFPELVPAPGAGKAVFVHSAFVRYNTLVPYTNVNDAKCFLIYGADWWDDAAGPLSAGLFIGQENNAVEITPAPYLISGAYLGSRPFQASAVENQAICFALDNNVGAIGGGDTSNVFNVTVFYSIVDL